MTDVLRLRKWLSDDQAPAWPAGISRTPVDETDPARLHALLADAYSNGFGSVAPLDQWWTSVSADDEYDPGLVFIATDADANPVGLALCWNSGFIKDVAVTPAWRGKGVGEALLRHVFFEFAHRGLQHVDLKVMAGNVPAIALYRRLGMIDVT